MWGITKLILPNATMKEASPGGIILHTGGIFKGLVKAKFYYTLDLASSHCQDKADESNKERELHSKQQFAYFSLKGCCLACVMYQPSFKCQCRGKS